MKVAVIVGLMCFSLALGQEPEVYLEAGDFKKARALWEQMDDPSIPAWQREIILYNIGVSYLHEKDWENAIEQFQLISLDQNSYPLLRENIKTNLAYAWLEKGEREKNRDALQQSLREVDLAIQASCELQKVKGAEACRLERNHEIIRRRAKEQLSLLPLQSKAELIRLLSSLRIAHSALEFLEKAQGDPQSEQYRNYWRETLQSWIPLWEAVVRKYSGNQELISAKESFIQGTAAIGENSLGKARDAMRSSEDALRSAMKELIGDAPVMEQLQDLVVLYEQASDQPILQQNALYVIESRQDEAGSLVDLSEADAYLRESLAALESFDQARARFLLEAAKYKIHSKLREVTGKKERLPKAALEDVIDDQEQALSLHRLFRQLEDPSKNYTPLLEQAQEQVMQTAPLFLEAIQKMETLKQEMIPWDEVLDSYHKGVYSAEDAKQILEKENMSGPAFVRQQQALNHFKRALQLMEPPAQGGVVEPEPSQDERPFEEVLRDLQEMEKSDRLPREKVEDAAEVPYPW